ncbi:MAG: branched-chain amino acid ABC transporter permease [Halomonas sp.]|jgi:branched-chain amino acid transport system permease protein|uniref:Branched-chain amino acid ABC transporter permease n=1 Tax=Billgrantia tianxiuensis TaxID=2497861 RepID=A0A6I6SG10_9GAMM|nr:MULTISPECIES: branched-chain amino acid ABC transporter permease [Halomonas]MCE8035151.1 branched-chain amino acid ABC transporter permease [Halomonas sp. MCCC 1A11057]MDX5433906.1 branched-chain amino acid ABC transporter permease [Halomonas sp.]MDX5503426.1 branched-chain amino acid ABC transporter permease [Halomonas sp.]QHC48331.1 branched-chain amino acid ABC transporter permease [Halomonas tianxiuensis]
MRPLSSALIVLGLLALLAVPFFPQLVYSIFVMKTLCFVLFACAFNLLLGHTGILSFGHAAFFGTGAYVTGQLVKAYGVPTELGILAGGLVAALLGTVVGALAIRRSGIYLAMITLALSQLVYFFFLQAPFTGAEDGLQRIPRGSFLGLDLSNDSALYYVVVGIVGAGLWLVWRTVNSPFGNVLRAIREHEPRAISLGYPVARYKVLVFTISAGLSGIAGSLKAIVFQLAALYDVHWHTSGDVILMTLLGGMSTVFGPAVGAALVSTLNHYLDPFGAWVTVITGLVFMACVLTFRQGVVGQLSLALRSRRSSIPAAKVDSRPRIHHQ